MEKQPNALGALFESAGDYLQTKVDLLKLKTVDKSSDVISTVVSSIVITLVITFGIFILNIGISIWLGAVLGKYGMVFLSLEAFIYYWHYYSLFLKING